MCNNRMVKCKNCENEAGNWKYEDNEFCSGNCMQEFLTKKNFSNEKLKPSKEILHAKHIGNTHSGKSLHLDRWECPHCKENNASEYRFNLNLDKRGKIWKCRFCKSPLLLGVKDE